MRRQFNEWLKSANMKFSGIPTSQAIGDMSVEFNLHLSRTRFNNRLPVTGDHANKFMIRKFIEKIVK